jgi:hypothetical protein
MSKRHTNRRRRKISAESDLAVRELSSGFRGPGESSLSNPEFSLVRILLSLPMSEKNQRGDLK